MTAHSDQDADHNAARGPVARIRDGIDNVRHYAGDAAGSAKDRARTTLDRARDGAETARTAAGDAYAAARETVRHAGTGTAERVEGNPMAATLGGLILGAAIGALVPRSRREAALLQPIGRRAADLARDAADAARDAGQRKLDELGLNRDHARDAMRSLIDGALTAAATAGDAALKSANKRGDIA